MRYWSMSQVVWKHELSKGHGLSWPPIQQEPEPSDTKHTGIKTKTTPPKTELGPGAERKSSSLPPWRAARPLRAGCTLEMRGLWTPRVIFLMKGLLFAEAPLSFFEELVLTPAQMTRNHFYASLVIDPEMLRKAELSSA